MSTTEHNNVSFKPAGGCCCIYALVCTDNILCVTEISMRQARDFFGSWDWHLPFEKEPGKHYPSMGSLTDVQELVKNVEAHLQKRHMELKLEVSSPLPINCSLELDNTRLCNNDVTECHSRIGVLCWTVKLGRIDTWKGWSWQPTHWAPDKDTW